MTDPVWARRTADGWALDVVVQPGARRSEIVGTYGDALKVRVAAPAVDDRANRALVAFLAGELGVAVRMVDVARGRSSRRKVVSVVGRPALAPLDPGAGPRDA